MQATALAQIPRLLTTPLQAEVVVVRVLLLDEEELEDLVVDVAVVDVVVIRVKLVVVAVAATGSTNCVVAQVTTPSTVEHDEVAMLVDAGIVEPSRTREPGQVSTPPRPVTQDVMVVVLCIVVTGSTAVV